jgi:dipeptidyl-peptidase-4
MSVRRPLPRPERALRAVFACSALALGACSALPETAHEASTADARASSAPPARQAVRTGKQLSLDDLYDPQKKVDFNGKPPSNQVWIDDDHWLWARTDSKTKKREWLRVDAGTGASEPFLDTAKLVAAVATIPGVTPESAERIALADTGALSDDRGSLLYSVRGDLYVHRLGRDGVVRVTETEAEEEVEGFSPDARRVAYVRGNDVWISELDPVREIRVTSDGGELVLNGKLDWLYQEEVYGRGKFDAKWWSPDSSSLAFLRLDEAGVPVYTLVDDAAPTARVLTSPYPRPGEPNPKVRLGVWNAKTAAVTWVDLARYADADPLIVDVAWSPRGELHLQVQDREQTWLDLVRVDASGATTTLFRETTKAWVEPLGSPQWLADGSFLWFSERTGWKHLYHYAADGKLLGAVTSGEWEARTLHGVDEKNGLVYFSGTERSPIGGDVYRVALAGGRPERLSQRPGTHGASFSPGFAKFLDHWSDAATPPQVRLHAADGRELRVLDANPVPALAEYAVAKPEFVTVETRDGFQMDAMLIKPVDFDPKHRYPVFQSTYAGPHSPSVKDAWGGTNGMFFQLLAQHGIVVWICDNRSASGKGAVSAWTAYQRLGPGELADIEDGITWLKKQPWVDGSRIALSGWSYGGFMTSYALTHSTSFACGLAGGSVTDWRNYDSIYTERLMRTPANNPKGYAETSVVSAAKDLSGRLLLVHGAIDDNVHPQNTMQLVHELEKANESFELMLYPKSAHGVGDPALARHWRTLMLEFLERNLLSPRT